LEVRHEFSFTSPIGRGSAREAWRVRGLRPIEIDRNPSPQPSPDGRGSRPSLPQTLSKPKVSSCQQTIHRGIKALIDEANAEIETLSAARRQSRLRKATTVVIVDIRDPRGDRGATAGFPAPSPAPARQCWEFWIDPAKSLCEARFSRPTRSSSSHCAGGMRSAAGGEKPRRTWGLKPGRPYGRRISPPGATPAARLRKFEAEKKPEG